MASLRPMDVSIERPSGAVIHCGLFTRVYIRTKNGYVVLVGSLDLAPLCVHHDPDVPLKFVELPKDQPGRMPSFADVRAAIYGRRGERRAG